MFAAGAVIGEKYRLEKRLGHGGMGVVWRARHVTLDQPVAVKVLDVRGPRAAVSVRRFLKEARIAAAVRHPNVVYISDFGTAADGAPFMVMELLEGESLAERMLHGPRMSVPELCHVVGGALGGLAAVHGADIIHRDIKPENIFLAGGANQVTPKILDFGLSRLNETESGQRQSSALTRDGVILGTLEYMSPEQARVRKDLDLRADIYGMGVVLYEALTGELPFMADNTADLMVAILSEEPPSVDLLRPELGEALSNVVERAMARDREQRFEDAGQMHKALKEALLQTPKAASMLLPETTDRPARPSPVPGSDALVDASGTATAPEPADALSISAPSVNTLKDQLTADSRRRRLWMGSALLALVVGALGWMLGVPQGQSDGIENLATRQASQGSVVKAATQPPTPSAPETRPPDEAKAPTTAELLFRSVPTDATLSVDGRPAHSPVLIPADGKTHTLRVERDGYEAWQVEHRSDKAGRYVYTPSLRAAATDKRARDPARRRRGGRRNRPAKSEQAGTREAQRHGGLVREPDF